MPVALGQKLSSVDCGLIIGLITIARFVVQFNGLEKRVLVCDKAIMKITADECGRLANAELFRAKATFDATVQPDGSIRLVELTDKQVPVVKPRRMN